jgi:ribosomal protein L37AE/L43A
MTKGIEHSVCPHCAYTFTTTRQLEEIGVCPRCQKNVITGIKLCDYLDLTDLISRRINVEGEQNPDENPYQEWFLKFLSDTGITREKSLTLTKKDLIGIYTKWGIQNNFNTNNHKEKFYKYFNSMFKSRVWCNNELLYVDVGIKNNPQKNTEKYPKIKITPLDR